MKVKKIKIFMFGGVTTLNENLNLNIYKEILLLIMGPLTEVLFLLILYLLNINNVIDNLTFTKFYNINIFLLRINLLPILPLDGGKLLNNLLDLLLPYQLSHKISIIISILFLPTLFIIDNKLLIIMLFIFLLLNIINEIDINKYKLELLIIERKQYNYKYKKCIKINNIKQIMRNKDYIFINKL